MRDFIQFWRQRFDETFKGVRGKVELVMFFLVLLAKPITTALVAVFPGLQLDSVFYWIVVVLFGLLLLVQLCFVAPYKHARRLEAEHAKALSELNEKASERARQNKVLQETIDSRPITARQLRNEIDALMAQMEAIIGSNQPEISVQSNQWLELVAEFDRRRLACSQSDQLKKEEPYCLGDAIQLYVKREGRNVGTDDITIAEAVASKLNALKQIRNAIKD